MSAVETFEVDPREIDPRPCELCGRTIDQHDCVDHGEGPEFYCFADDDIVQRWELADPRDRWKHTGEPRPNASPDRPASAAPYRTPQSTIDAFFHVARLDDTDYLARWLAQHPLDVITLQKLWDSKHARV